MRRFRPGLALLALPAESHGPARSGAFREGLYDDSHQVTYQDKAYYDDVQNTRITDNTYDLGDQYGYDGAKRLVTVLRGVDTADIGTALATNLTNGDYDDEVVYTYDQTGNRTALAITPQGGSTTTTTYAHNTVNEMTTEDGATLTYDANGAYTDSSADSNGFAYNHADQLAEYDDGTDVWTFHFDGLGRRVQRDLDSTGRSVRFYYDGIHCVDQVNELSNNENATKSFVYGSGIDELLEYVDRAPNPDVPYYVHADRLGSVMLLVDTNGAIEESYRYEEFGSTVIVDDTFAEVTTNPHVSPVGNPYRYTGRRQDIMIQASVADDDWYYSRARNLRTEVGRFVVRDPLEYVDGPNLALYARGAPVSYRDPHGTDTEVCFGSSVSGNGCSGAGCDSGWLINPWEEKYEGFYYFPPGGCSEDYGCEDADSAVVCCGPMVNGKCTGCSYFDLSDVHYGSCTANCSGPGGPGWTPGGGATMVCDGKPIRPSSKIELKPGKKAGKAPSPVSGGGDDDGN